MEYKPEHAVEIGVYAGRSLIAMALAMNELSHGTAWGIDPWSAEASMKGFSDPVNRGWWGKLNHNTIKQSCETTMVKMGVANRIHLIQMTNRTGFEEIKSKMPKIDFLSIDGNHSPEESCFDVENYVPMVPSGAPIFFDDVDWKETEQAVHLMLKTCKLKEIVDNCGIFVKL